MSLSISNKVVESKVLLLSKEHKLSVKISAVIYANSIGDYY